jgi:hypothetical protein
LLPFVKFSSIEEAISAVDGRFAAKPREIFLDGLKKEEQGSYMCVCGTQGEYVE